MADDVSAKRAVDTAWSVYRATHDVVDAADNRRCLLEQRLPGRREAREPASFGPAYLARLPEDECWRRVVEVLAERIAADSGRPEWTLLAISYFVSAVIVLALRSVMGA